MSNILAVPGDWTDPLDNSPPASWDGDVYEWFGVFGAGGDAQGMTFTGSVSDMPMSMTFSLTTGANAYSTPTLFVAVINGVETTYELEAEETQEITLDLEGCTTLELKIISGADSQYPYSYSMDISLLPISAVDNTEDMNCDCDSTYPRSTLLEMYNRVLRRMGYGAQLARPPPGNKETVFDYIRQAQHLAMADFDEIGHLRFFKWNMAVGQRFYAVDENDDECTKLLQHLTIQAVWIRRYGKEKGVYSRLRRCVPVIPPEYYSGGIYNSTPMVYAVRQCIEVWPPPSEEMELIVLGNYRNLPLVVDGDFTTADPEAIFLRAVALYKADKGHPSAEIYMGQYNQYIGNVNADQHRDVRFIPPWNELDRRDCDYAHDRLTHLMDPLVYGG